MLPQLPEKLPERLEEQGETEELEARAQNEEAKGDAHTKRCLEQASGAWVTVANGARRNARQSQELNRGGEKFGWGKWQKQVEGTSAHTAKNGDTYEGESLRKPKSVAPRGGGGEDPEDFGEKNAGGPDTG